MPNKKKLYDALVKEGYNNFENEDAFNAYVESPENRKTLYNALVDEGFDNFEDESAFHSFLGYGESDEPRTTSGGVGTQEEADAIFEANAERYRQGLPIQRVTTQSVLDAQNKVPDSEIQRLQGIMGKAQRQIDDASFFDRFFDEETRTAVATRNKAEEALEMYDEANREKETWFDRNVVGALKGFADKVGDLSTWDFGASGVASAVALKDAVAKMEAGEKLSSAEQNLLDAYGLASAVQAAYQDKVGMAYNVGGSLPESVAFGASLALNPVGGVGKKIGEAAAKAAVKKYGTALASKLAKGAARVGGDVIEMGVATAVPWVGAGRVAEDYYNRLNGQATFDIDENGIVRYGGQVQQEEADNAIWKAMGSQFIENYSEAMGNYFAPMGQMLSNLTSKGLKAAHLGKFAEVLSDVSSSQFSKGLQRFKQATKFDGLVGEYLEEVAGNVMNAATVGDMNFNSPDDPRSVFNPETNIETFLSCALLSGTMYAVEAPVSMYNKNVAKKNLNKADTEAKRLWGDRWDDMRSQMDEADPQLLAQLLTGVQNVTDLSDEQKQAAKDYGMRLMQYQGYNARRMQNVAESTSEANAINNAYDEGSDLQTPADKHQAKLAVDRAEAALGEDAAFVQTVMNGAETPVATINAMAEQGYSEEQIQKAKDYYSAMNRMNGMTDALLDEVDSQIESANVEVDMNTNKELNQVIKVVLRDGRQGYVVNGTVTANEEGVVDVNHSDSEIMVRFENGDIEMMNPNKDLQSVAWIDSPAKLKENNNTVLRQSLIDNGIQEIDWNPATPNPRVGDSFEMDGIAVTIVGHDGHGGMFVLPSEEWQAAQGSEQKQQAAIAKAQQMGVVQAGMFKQWASDQLDAQEEAQAMAEAEAVAEEVVAETQPTEEVAAQPEAEPVKSVNEAAPVEEAKLEKPVIPTKEDGSVDFVAYGKEGTFKILGEKYGEKMPKKVEVTAKALANDLKKAENAIYKAQKDLDNAPIGRDDKQQAKLDKAKQDYEAVKREADFWAEMDADIKAAQAQREALLNPVAEVDSSAEPQSVDEFVAQQLASGNIVLNKEDFKRETGFGTEEVTALNGGTQKLLTDKGMTIQEAGERLMEMDRENGTNFFDQSDPNAGRDALIDLLGSVKTRKELDSYIKDKREYQAERETEALRSEVEDFIRDNFHMTPEDYATLLEVEMQNNPYEGVDLKAIDAIFAEKEFGSETLNEQENESEGNVDGNSGESELLHEEQAGEPSGNNASPTDEQAEGIGSGTPAESETSQASQSSEVRNPQNADVFAAAEKIDAEEKRRRPLRARANEWAKALGVKVHFIERVEDVKSANVREALKNGNKVAGWYSQVTGEVFFLMPNLDNVDEIDNTYVHEVVAHKGMFDMLGKERYDELCDKVWEMMPKSEQDKFINYPGVNGNTRIAADEYIAHLSESLNLSPEQQGIWDKIVQFFRELFDQKLNGILSKSNITNDDISNLIRASYANLKSGANENVVGEGERFRFSKTPEEFDAIQKEAVEKKGIVIPGLNEAVVDVLSIEKHDFNGNLKQARKEAKQWAIENYQGKEFSLPGEGGLYTIGKKAINKYVDKTSVDKSDNAMIHLSALKELPNIISSSVTGEIHADYKKDENEKRNTENGIKDKGLLVHRMYGAIKLDDKTYRVKTTMNEYRDPLAANNPHSYEVTEIELIESSSTPSSKDDSKLVNVSNNSITGTKLLNGVEKSYDKGKKLLDESEKTRFRVVYHGSGAEFDRFDHSFMGTGEGNQSFGWGTYVTDVKGIGENYGTIALRGKDMFEYIGDQSVNRWVLADAKQMMDRAGGYDEMIKLYGNATLAPGTAAEQAVNFLKSTKKEDWEGQRHLYEVEIPDDNGSNYIAWDKMLPKEQAERIKEAIRNSSFFKDYENEYKRLAEERLDAWTKTNGGRVYKLLGNIVWNEKDLSQILSEAGFVGFKYPTNYMSGGNKEGTNNYVIFNEDDLKIVEHTRFRLTNAEKEALRDSEETKALFDYAKKRFGRTFDLREAGYVLPDGSMLDFSGRHEMFPGSDTSFLRGDRSVDHRGIVDVAYDFEGEETGFKTDMADFLNRGAIRIDGSTGAIDLTMKPTSKQKDILRRLVQRMDGDVWIDFSEGWDSEHYVEYTGVKPMRVLSDIDKYYDEGIKPEGNTRFRIVDNEKQKQIDKEYVDAVHEGDFGKAVGLFREYVLSKAEEYGVVPIDYAVGYRGHSHSSIAKKVKEENPDAISEAAYQMSKRVPKGSILVPMPSRSGKATYTIKLAEAIAKATDSEVRDVLKGEERMSVYEAKKKGLKIDSRDLGLYVTEKLPKDKNVIIIDNVIDRGITALAAVEAVDGGSVLAYAFTKGSKDRVVPLKLSDPITYDDNLRIIPLSERFNANTDDLRFRVLRDPAVDYISQAEDIVEVPRDMEFFTMNNVANKLYQNSGRFMRDLYKYGTIGRVLKGEYAEIDQIKAKKEYDHAKPILDEYLNQLVWMKHHATEAAQEVINDVISDVEYAMQYYKDLALGKDVWRTNVSPRFRISEYGKQVKAEVDRVTSKYKGKEVMFFDAEMTDEEVAAVAPGYTAADLKLYFDKGVLGGYSSRLDKISIFADNNPVYDVEDTIFHENLHVFFTDNKDIVEAFAGNALSRFPKNVKSLQEKGYSDKEIPEELLVRLTAKAMSYGIFDDVRYNLPESEFEKLKEFLKHFGYDYREEVKSRSLEEGRRGTPTLLGGEEVFEARRVRQDSGRQKEERRARKEELGKLFDQVADMGLDGVLGNRYYGKLLMDIYQEMPLDVRRYVSTSAVNKYGGDFVPAMSDYLNVKGTAEIWGNVVGFVRDVLRKVGFDLELNQADVKYMLWRSQKPMKKYSALDVAEDIDARRKFGVDEGERFRTVSAAPFDPSDKRNEIVKKYDAFLKKGKFNFIEAFQDRMYSVKVFMDMIVEATGKKVRDFEDAYEAENQLGSINKPAEEKYLKNFYKPVVETLNALYSKYGRDAMERYIYCKSGLERNEVLRQRDADEAFNASKEELDEKLAKGQLTQPQYDALLQQAEDQRQQTLSEDVDYSGIRGMLFNLKAQAINKEYEEGRIDKSTRDTRLANLEANRKNVVQNWKQFAENEVAAIESRASSAELKDLWKKINAATNETLRMDYESGMIDKATYDAEKNMMKYYVPLRNWADTTAEEMYEYRSELVRPVSSNQKRAKGRESQADNPIATIALMAQNAIVRGNRNKVKQKFYAFVANRETGLASVRDVWYVKDPTTDTWEAKYADTTNANDAAEFAQILDDFETDMQLLESQGLAYKGKLPLGMKFRASRQQKKAHVVPVMINGKEYAVYVNGNPRPAQAMNGETNSEAANASAWYDKIKRIYGAGLTSWNPDFIIPNMIRDGIHASTMTFLDAGPIAAARFALNGPRAFGQVFAMISGFGKGLVNPQNQAYFEEFVANGGETGYTAIHTLEDYKKEYDKLMNEVKGLKGNFMKKGIQGIAKFLEATNRIFEDVNRFNAYVSARESGESIMRSISAAKNITVNFNRKGALSANNTAFGTIANAMSKWILFFNPAVQGIAQLVTKTKVNPKRAAAMASSILASGFFMPMLNEMLVAANGGDDEDDYWNQSDFKRRNNWLFFTGDGYASVPLPPVLRELYGIGDIIYGSITGHITPQRAVMDMARQVQSAVGFVNLIPEVSQEPDMVTWAKGFAPDIAAPVLDVISNTNFMGRPIAKWTDFNEYEPEYERVYKGVSPQWVWLSKLLNKVGGDEGRRSDVWGNFINPAMMEHLFTNYGGGIGKTINNLAGMALEEDTENLDPYRKIPIVPRFYIPNDEKTVVPAINRKYYDYDYMYNVAKKALKTYQDGVRSKEHPEWKKYIDEMQKNGEIEFIRFFEHESKRLTKLQNLIKGNPTNKKELEEKMIDLKADIATKCYEMLK